MAGSLSAGAIAGLMALSAAMGYGGNMATSAINNKRTWKYTRKAMELQDIYNRRYTVDQYGLMRQGLSQAGYNPLLALGSSASTAMPSASGPNADSDNGSQSITSAIQTMDSLNNAKVTSAQSGLLTEQAKTEQAKRIQMEFQNAESDIRKRLLDKDLDKYDEKHAMNMLDMMERVKSMRAQSALGVARLEAEKQDINNRYELGKYKNETERRRSRFQNYHDYMDSKYGNPIKTAGFSWDSNRAHDGWWTPPEF